ncbi:ArsR/SmtB family transcription factor [Halolamina salifodinae]|uniref:DNA-binding transcriptional ArsR family regulator n=1 Tax=Halolamina salifodinae TaxID=1202767 RepID=A0A8T4GWM5_9EURY|nr:metalloregulator ArsR/SmtB family transcription factor [Halolamina salifodinae]MBP1986860.1 DNA-binding transcriptional ArsR family regulator [Halolamina salifodinae]
MTESRPRLRRRIEAEVGECCDADVEQRLAELDELADAAGDGGVDAFAALGNDTRHRLTRLLSAAEGDLCVCELDPLVDVSESAVSHALADLVDAGLASRRKEGNWRYYRSTDLAEDLLAVVDQEGDA